MSGARTIALPDRKLQQARRNQVWNRDDLEIQNADLGLKTTEALKTVQPIYWEN